MKDTERKNWEIYLAAISNPCAKVGSFEDFIKKHTVSTSQEEMTKKEIEKQVENSTSILENFTPPNKK